MRAFRSSYTDKEGRSRATATFYIEFRDHKETLRRMTGFADRKTTESLGRNIQKLVWCKAGGQALDPVQTKWIEGLSPYLTRKLAEFGILDAGKVAALRPLAQHLDGGKDAPGWRQHLAAKGNTAQHVETSCSRVLKVIEGCKFAFWSDVSASKVLAYLDGLRANKTDADGKVRPGLGPTAFNHYLTAFKSFCKWMVRDGRASENPVAHLTGLNARTDLRRQRRALSVEELRRLLDATRNGPDRFGMTGPERATLYRVAVETGLRRGELASLTRASFALDGGRPTVTVQAAYSKHRREDVLPIRPDTAADLRDFLACKMPDSPAFAVPASRHESAAMFRADLEAVGLRYVDAAGRYADFHALRHTCGSLLAASGVHPKVAQSIMRHCTIDLTMSRYTHVFAGQEADAVAALPDLGRPAKGSAKATGTDDRPVLPDATAGPRTGGDAPAPIASPRPDNADGEEARNSLALCLALQGTFPRATVHDDAPKARWPQHAENTGESRGNRIKSGPRNSSAEVAELADAQDSKSCRAHTR